VPDDDQRLVQIGADSVARVIDAGSGEVLSERGNVGDSSAKYLAYDGRLFVAGSDGGYQVDAYDLDSMGEPRNVYRAPDDERRLGGIAPCGEERVCLLDTRSSEADTTEVAAIDVAGGGQKWREGSAGAEQLVPVGDGVLVQRTTGTPGWSLRDAEGAEVLRRDGTAVRLDAGNVLAFVGTLSSSEADLSIAGVGVEERKATELGPLRQARGATCSWNSQVIACMAETDFVLWRFAEE